MFDVEFVDTSCQFKDFLAVDSVSFGVKKGEFFSLLGPSGSGKTTSLRLVAGFLHPSKGKILIEGKESAHLPPFKRNVNTVFQDYALFPHMTVFENIAYGLRIKKVKNEDIQKQVLGMLELVRLPSLKDRKPSELSGGQKQRIALARALVNQPRVLLLDEPLSALDLKLRQEMQIELKEIQKKVGITFIFVTHDQEEALSMSDKIVVFNHGKIEQIGTPEEIYESPHTEFVARFVGESNIFTKSESQTLFGINESIMIRPETISIDSNEIKNHDFLKEATVIDSIYTGITNKYILNVNAIKIIAYSSTKFPVHTKIHLGIHKQNLKVIKK